ncbi:triose-phosphate isomerase [Anaerotignum sp.]|uniref:triose-phosphate isomerase n=1 Tax=Anaerotignum sp. TaxID=2039241 RepID=UPI00332A5A17
MMRKKIIAGNWKMNKTPKEAAEFCKEMKSKVASSEVDVVFCVPFVDLHPVLEELQGSRIGVGAENMHFENSGAYTGEISPLMLKEMGVSYVVLGHSERRQFFNETDEMVNKKVKKALEVGITPIMCCGETLEQREAGITIEWIRMQVKFGLSGISAEEVKKVVIAYEPIWAIGTGKTATSEQAQEVCKAIRQVVGEVYGQNTADQVRIQYGGSVNGKNAAELFAMADIDGGLVGGASLKDEFQEIVHYQK